MQDCDLGTARLGLLAPRQLLATMTELLAVDLLLLCYAGDVWSG